MPPFDPNEFAKPDYSRVSDLIQRGHSAELEETKKRAEYKAEILDTLKQIRDAVVYLANREHDREAGEKQDSEIQS